MKAIAFAERKNPLNKGLDLNLEEKSFQAWQIAF